jgi:hypothetical protein
VTLPDALWKPSALAVRCGRHAERTPAAAEAVKEVKRDAERQREADHDVATAMVADSQELHAQAKNTLQAMGVEATTSHYGTYARQERRAANFWTWMTVVLGVAGVLTIMWALHEVGVADGDPSWAFISLKSLAGLTILAIAGYVGSEAHGHRVEERRAKSRELALAALDPFLANVDDAGIHRLRLALAADLFVQPAGDSSSAGWERLGPGGLVKAVLESQGTAEKTD